MNLLCSALIQKIYGLSKLRSPYNGIVNEQQTFSVNQFMDRKIASKVIEFLKELLARQKKADKQRA